MFASANPSVDRVDRSSIALIADVLHRFGEARVRVTGSSMLPSIWPGDVLTIRRRAIREVRTGEIAVFTRHDRLFAHRVVAHAGRRLVTQGDAVPSRDAPVNEAELLGAVVSVSRDGRNARPPKDPRLAGRLVAALFRRSSRVNMLLQRLGRVRSAVSKLEA